MMKQYMVVAFSIIFAAFFSSTAYAGQHVYGAWSENEDRAMKSAFMMAEAKVRSRGKGCVGRGVNDNTTEELVMEEKGDKVRYGVFISFHRGSCGSKESIIRNISRETGIDINKIIAAWIGS